MPYKSSAKPSLYGIDGTSEISDAGGATAFHSRCGRPRISDVRSFCLVLAHTGCRISEALALTRSSVELEGGFIAIRSLKKRQPFPVIRQVPVPRSLLRALVGPELLSADSDGRLWQLSRTSAWQRVKRVNRIGRYSRRSARDAQGTAARLCVHAIQSGVPINLVQRWLGHASMATTAIYLDVVGREERKPGKTDVGSGGPWCRICVAALVSLALP